MKDLLNIIKTLYTFSIYLHRLFTIHYSGSVTFRVSESKKLILPCLPSFYSIINLFFCIGVLHNFVKLGLVKSRITIKSEKCGCLGLLNVIMTLRAASLAYLSPRPASHLDSCVGNMLQGMLESNFSQTLSPLSLMYQAVCRALSPV